MKIHKLEDGDIIKILPMIDKNNNISWIKSYDCVGWGNTKFITDTSDEKYLRRISDKLIKTNSSVKLPIGLRHSMNIYIDGEIRILSVGKALFDLIINNQNLLDLRGNHQIYINKREVGTGSHFFPSFDKSYVFKKSWIPPVNDINSKDEWFSYIKSNQPDFNSYLEKSNIFNHKKELINYLGSDMLSEFISDDREKKLNKLLS